MGSGSPGPDLGPIFGAPREDELSQRQEERWVKKAAAALVVAAGILLTLPAFGGQQDGPDPIGPRVDEIEVSCLSDGTVEVASWSVREIDDLHAIVESCWDGLAAPSSDLEEPGAGDDDPFIEGAGACSTLVDCATHCGTRCLLYGGAKGALLVDDLASTATGQACSCTCRHNEATAYVLCISPRPPKK
jgi:hypothetical protein